MTIMTTKQHNHQDTYFTFAPRLLAWFESHGRHDLPWQQHKKAVADVYAVWLSEIMLQQTQVATVIGYFNRFIQTLPTVYDLAAADWEVVADLWAGLGYYARARNLHAGAKQVVEFIQKHGDFPQTIDEWQAIKGVGRSTAGAIVAMGVGGRGVICDGNVKRVLTRHWAIADDISKTTTDKLLWQLAENLTPKQHSGHFAQAMMDLGATICTRTKPKCKLCPVSDDCVAYQQHNPTDYPVKAKKSTKPSRHSLALRIFYQNQVLWLKRAEGQKSGIWEGLWCLPLLTISQLAPADITADTLIKQLYVGLSDDEYLGQAQFLEHQLFCVLSNLLVSCQVNAGQTIKHTLTHFYWYLSLIDIHIDDELFIQINQVLSASQGEFTWQSKQTAIPTAMVKLLKTAS